MDSETKDDQGHTTKEVTIIDKVKYKNLEPGREYRLSGVLMDKAKNTPLLNGDTVITAEKTFTPDKSSGEIEMTFTVDSTLLEGTTTVVFENLYTDDIELAIHADIDDEGTIFIDGTDFSEIVKRAESRLTFQELKKQTNIDCVVGYAAQSLSSVEQVSDDPVDVDWITRFFDSVADVSSQEMQVIWGRILAGEVNQPGSFSLRTLEIVKNLSKSDAELFTKVATLVVTSESEKLICSDSEILNKYGISYTNLMLLDECGLINSSGTLSYNPIVTKKHKYFFYSTERIAIFTGLSDGEIQISFGVHTLTSAGRELLSIVESKPSNDYFLDYVKNIESNYKGKIKATVHIVDEIIDKKINYKTEPLHNINSTVE